MPFESDETVVTDAIAVGDGFVAVGTTKAGGQLTGRVWRSADGRSWDRIDDPGIAALVPARILEIGGTLVLLGDRHATGDREKNVELWRSADGRTWTQGPTLPVPGDGLAAAGGPAGILLPVDHDTYLIGPDLGSWNKTTTWPTDVYLGSPVWSGGRWIQPGATGVVGANAPTTASIWTSTDGRTWTAASVDPSPGAVRRVYPAQDGVLALGQSSNLCLVCFGLFNPLGVAWASADGTVWTGVDPGVLHLDSGHGGRFVGDGRRLLEVGPVPGVMLGDAPAWSVASQTLNGRGWTPVGGTGLDESVLAGHLVIGARGVAILPGAVVDTTSGSFRPQPWWGEATEQGSVQPSLPTVTGCDTLGFGARRCVAVVAQAREQAGNPEGVIGVVVRRFVGNDVSLGSYPIATVGFTLSDGTSTAVDIRCFLGFGPASSNRVCSDDPQIRINGGVSRDIPCGPTPCDEHNPGATPPPSARPAVVAASTPLVLQTFDVPIDHIGHYELLVGSASLPDGLLSERSGTLGDPRPTAYWIDDGVQIVVRPGKPCLGSACPEIDSVYHKPFHGPQPVHVYLIFDVVELNAPGTILEIRNLVVR